jgi:ubiquinone/menaquinone biosynthesis C-methylase UbiE
MNQTEFKQFFSEYAQNVDQAEQQYFWKLSDELMEGIIRNHIPTDIPSDAVILDAGGGTGRWIVKLSSLYPCRFDLVDLSEDMLAKAQTNISNADLHERVRILQSDLSHMPKVADASVDYIVSIYSPISFVNDLHATATEFSRVLKPGGMIMIMGQGLLNAIASKINNYLAAPEELREIAEESRVRWAEFVPKLNMFTQESLQGILTDAGFEPVRSYGVPVFVQPGAEDFDSKNIEQSRISKALRDRPDFYSSLLEIERRYHAEPSIVNRGMNIVAVARKRR